MRRRYGFAELDPADGPVTRAIFGGANARLYGVKRAGIEAFAGDRFATIKSDYETSGPQPSLRRYGFVAQRRGTACCVPSAPRSWGPQPPCCPSAAR